MLELHLNTILRALTVVMQTRGSIMQMQAGKAKFPKSHPEFERAVAILDECCHALNFKGTKRCLDALRFKLQESSAKALGVPAPELLPFFDHLHEAICSEFGEHVVLIYAAGETQLFRSQADEIKAAFDTVAPTVPQDIDEARLCLVHGRYTASVFHLMRAVEASVDLLLSKLGISPSPLMLGPKLDEIDKAIKLMVKGAEKEQWHQLNAYLHSIKDAWRNPTMHPKNFYDLTDARVIYDNVLRLLPKVKAMVI